MELVEDVILNGTNTIKQNWGRCNLF